MAEAVEAKTVQEEVKSLPRALLELSQAERELQDIEEAHRQAFVKFTITETLRKRLVEATARHRIASLAVLIAADADLGMAKRYSLALLGKVTE
jgi:hypothetical protein